MPISLVNTFLAMSIDVETRKPRLTNVTGGLSGPAIKPIAVRMVYEAARAVSIPIIGLGGIVTAEDAVEFMLAGATAVQVGTASYADPRATERLAKGLESWCRSHHVERVAGLTGALDVPQKYRVFLQKLRAVDMIPFEVPLPSRSTPVKICRVQSLAFFASTILVSASM